MVNHPYYYNARDIYNQQPQEDGDVEDNDYNYERSASPEVVMPIRASYQEAYVRRAAYDNMHVTRDSYSNNYYSEEQSNASDTTTTYVENSDMYDQQDPEPESYRKSKKKKKSGAKKNRRRPSDIKEYNPEPIVNPYDKINSPHLYRSQDFRALPAETTTSNSISSQAYLDDAHLENQLQNEKRWFSWMFSKEVPIVPLPEERTEYPWNTTTAIKKLFFWWLWPVLVKGYKRTLQPNDLWTLPKDLTVEDMHMKWEGHMQKILSNAEKNHLKKHSDLSEFQWPLWAVPWALFLTFKIQYTLSCIFLALSFVCQSLSPLLTRRLIDYVEYRYFGIETTLNKGIGYTLGSVVLIFVNGLLLNHFFHTAMITGAQSKAILTKALLLKSFGLSAKSRHLFSVGRITSLMSTDLARIDLAIGFQPLVLCFPIPVIIAVVLLLVNIGVCSLTGIGLFIFSLLICVIATKKLFDTRELVVKYTDERISLMREVLNNLKVIKFYAWEWAYKMSITRVRDKEMKYLFTIKVLRNFITAYAVTLPTLTSMISFVTMWKTGNMKSPGAVFSSLSLFSILAQAIMLLPIALATGADAMIGFTRCRDYLSATEYDDDLKDKLDAPIVNEKYYIGEDSYASRSRNPDRNVIEVSHANFVWESFHDDLDSDLWDIGEDGKKIRKEKQKKKSRKEKKAAESAIAVVTEKEDFKDSTYFSKSTFVESVESLGSQSSHTKFPGLVDVNLTIKKNEFIIVTGVIGSGKTSLLNALAGFMKIANPTIGSLKINDDLLLCSAPWIQNATVRENILFGKNYDPVKYNQVLHACALQDDLAILPAGDRTEIGERGITLSGGQKARINLARACYAEAEILLFDDVISAVDARVGRHIVNHLFKGLLKNKTIVLATHQLGILESADRIVFLNGDGSVDCGTATELLLRNVHFQRLIEFSKEHEPESNNNSDYNLNVTVADGDVDDEDEMRLTRQRSLAPEQADLAGRTTTDEERATNAISWSVYKKYINLGAGFFGWTAAPVFLFLVALATFCQLFTNTWLSFWTEKKFKGMSDNMYIALYVAFACLTVVFTAIEFTMLAYMNNTSANALNVRAVNKILHAPMSFMDTTPLGRILNRFTKDTDSLDNEIGEQLRLFIFPLATIIGILILCTCYLPWFAIAIPFLAFGFTFLANFYQGSSREIKRLEATQRSLVYNNFNETLTGMDTIKSFKAEGDFIKKNDLYLNKMNEAYYLSIATQRWLCVHLDVITSVFALIICMLCITEQFNISASSTGLLLNYVIQIVGLLALTVRSMTQVENEMNSVERLHEYSFHLPQEAAYEKPECSPPQEWPPSGYIQFKDVTMRYRPNLPTVLKNMNLNIYPGEKVGICGRTGAGKSSIMTALYRLTEVDEGAITIDGLDIANMGLHDLRSRLSIIPQDPVLFQGSIRKNLDPFGEYSENTLWDALRRSGLLDEHTIHHVRQTRYDPENGIGYEDLHKFHLDQVVEDDGANFSLGERQLIALARSLIRNSKILILDEATSSVDFETDSKIQSTIASEFKHCTILCIAHRLKTILHYDRIVVMDQGQIVEKGVPWTLYNENGAFKKMCDKANITADDFQS
ncbi:uncharacterized protein RJT20DRAFT_130772 [Scheffersomyces xylosifermentans]|uniref:uncharacterized protein n=1 Tax=Scheffersomyces xylosifermentans TaxID=1304137 RepID=UPI00315C701C